MQEQQPQKRQLRLEIPPNLNATFANMVMISHTPNEIFFDFIQILPNDPRARVQQRIVMTPAHAKMFLQAMQENIAIYEGKNGEIKIPPRPESLADQLFRSVRPNEDDES